MRPEMAVRRELHAAGLRYRLHARDLPGRPDVVRPSRRTAILIHGCFWHQYGCGLSHAPASRLEYWGPKLARNRERDAAAQAAVHDLGWTVLTVWEYETRKQGLCEELARTVKALPVRKPGAVRRRA
jgi:DNA mismatch endonuclease (patch repair protein)